MKSWIISFMLLLMIMLPLYSQNTFHTEEQVYKNDSITLQAKLAIPSQFRKPPVVLLITGSGPTDMDGNNFFMKNNHIKYLAEALAEDGIATLRYNKRTIASNNNIVKEEMLKFDEFVEDAVFLLNELKNDPDFGRVYLIGHSQGALIATLAAQKVRVKTLFLIAAPGEKINKILVRQIASSGMNLEGEARIITDSLAAGHRVKMVHPLLYSVFKPDLQGFLMSWMKYDPAIELKKVKSRKVIIQGERDIQVSKEDALRLEELNPKADLYFIEEMNHIFKNAPEERQENLKTYSDPDLPINEKLVDIISGYIK